MKVQTNWVGGSPFEKLTKSNIAKGANNGVKWGDEGYRLVEKLIKGERCFIDIESVRSKASCVRFYLTKVGLINGYIIRTNIRNLEGNGGQIWLEKRSAT